MSRNIMILICIASKVLIISIPAYKKLFHKTRKVSEYTVNV